jgi:hypothetical protein
MRPETTIKLKRIIKEEIRSVLEEQDPSQTALDAIAREIGVQGISGPSKNKFREREFKVGYTWHDRGDDMESDIVTVMARDEDEAIEKVKKDANWKAIAASKHALRLGKPDTFQIVK